MVLCSGLHVVTPAPLEPVDARTEARPARGHSAPPGPGADRRCQWKLRTAAEPMPLRPAGSQTRCEFPGPWLAVQSARSSGPHPASALCRQPGPQKTAMPAELRIWRVHLSFLLLAVKNQAKAKPPSQVGRAGLPEATLNKPSRMYCRAAMVLNQAEVSEAEGFSSVSEQRAKTCPIKAQM